MRIKTVSIHTASIGKPISGNMKKASNPIIIVRIISKIVTTSNFFITSPPHNHSEVNTSEIFFNTFKGIEKYYYLVIISFFNILFNIFARFYTRLLFNEVLACF